MSNRNNQTSTCRQMITYHEETKPCGGQGVEHSLFHTHYECNLCGSEWTTKEQEERDAAED